MKLYYIFINNGGDIYGVINPYQYIMFTNNIFYGISAYSETLIYYCEWNNNVTFLTSNNDLYITGTSSGGNNLINTNPMFVDVPLENPSFEYIHDFHLQAGSTLIDAGTDGTDIGIYGGLYPWPESEIESPFQTSPMPSIPQVIEMNINNSVIPVNGTINIDIEAISND